MQLFFHPQLNDNLITISPEESRHIAVLRFKPGDSLYLTDGQGTLCKAIVADSSLKACQVQIMERYDRYKEQPYYLHIAMAPTKQMDRFEWFLEKSTEIGISEITPILCHQSERKIIKTDRLQKILQSAIKQSLKAWLPKLNEAVSFEEFIKTDFNGKKFIANAETGKQHHLKSEIITGEKTLVLIGPEGDFTSGELLLASKNGFTSVNLGENRLRTETAGILSCALVALHYS